MHLHAIYSDCSPPQCFAPSAWTGVDDDDLQSDDDDLRSEVGMCVGSAASMTYICKSLTGTRLLGLTTFMMGSPGPTARVLASHAHAGSITRTRWELIPSIDADASSLAATPQHWLYLETRCVLLIDLRRGSLVWSRQPHEMIDLVLTSLAAGPSSAPSKNRLKVHITVALSGREGQQLRVLVHGYCHHCGESAEPLCELVREQLRLALTLCEPSMPTSAAFGRGLHSCVRDGIFCLSLLPTSAAPSLAILTDAVGSPLDAPLLGLRQFDVALAIILCMDVADHDPSHTALLPPGEQRDGDGAFGLIADPESHQRAAEDAAGVILCPTVGTVASEQALAAARLCIANALMLRPPAHQLAAALHARFLRGHAPPAWRLPCKGDVAAVARGKARHKERLHMYEVPAAITLADLLHTRLAEGFRLCEVPTAAAAPLPGQHGAQDPQQPAHTATDVGGMARNAESSSPVDAQELDDAPFRAAHTGTVAMRLCCEWCSADPAHAVTIEYLVRSSSPTLSQSTGDASTAELRQRGTSGGSMSDSTETSAAPIAAESTIAAATRQTGDASRDGNLQRGTLRIYLSVVAPLPFWLRFERARLHRRQFQHAERSDAAALQTFVERVRHRDRRLARLAAAVCGSDAAWQSALTAGALSDPLLLPRIAPEITLVPAPQPAACVVASLTVRSAASSTVRLHLRTDDRHAPMRWAMQQLLRPALASVARVDVCADVQAHVGPAAASSSSSSAAAAAVSSTPQGSGAAEACESDSIGAAAGMPVSKEPGPLLPVALQMVSEELTVPWAMVVRVTKMPSGLVTICPSGFRTQQQAASEAALALWRRVRRLVGDVVRRTDVWQSLHDTHAFASSLGLRLSLTSGAGAQRSIAASDAINSSCTNGGLSSPPSAAVTGELDTSHGWTAVAAAAGSAVSAMELVTAPMYELEGDDEGEADSEDDPTRERPHSSLASTAAACLWQQRWSWQLTSSRAAEVLLQKLVQARRQEGWWCSSPPSVRSAMLCRSITLRRTNVHSKHSTEHPEAASTRSASADRAEVLARHLQGATIHALDESYYCTVLLQYGLVAVGPMLVVTYWQEPQYGIHPSGESDHGGESIDSCSIFARLSRWFAQCDAHLAGGTSAILKLTAPVLRPTSLGRKTSLPNVRTPTEARGHSQPIALPVQHLLPHGRYFRWPIRQLEAPMRNEVLHAKLLTMLQSACDGAVAFSEPACSLSSLRVPVPRKHLVPRSGVVAGAIPPSSIPRPAAESCVVLRGEPARHDGATLVGLVWLAEDGERGTTACACICACDDLAPPPMDDRVLSALFSDQYQRALPSESSIDRNAAAANGATPQVGRGAPTQWPDAAQPQSVGAAVDRLRHRLETRLAMCAGPAAIEALFEGLHSGAIPTASDLSYSLASCDVTHVLSLPIDVALHGASAPAELAVGLEAALAVSFSPVRCSAGPPTAEPTAVAQSTQALETWLTLFAKKQESPLFLRVGLIAESPSLAPPLEGDHSASEGGELVDDLLAAVTRLHTLYVASAATPGEVEDGGDGGDDQAGPTRGEGESTVGSLQGSVDADGSKNPIDARLVLQVLRPQAPWLQASSRPAAGEEDVESLRVKCGEMVAALSLRALRCHYPLNSATLTIVREQMQLLASSSQSEHSITLNVAMPDALPLLTADLSRLVVPRADLQLTRVCSSESARHHPPLPSVNCKPIVPRSPLPTLGRARRDRARFGRSATLWWRSACLCYSAQRPALGGWDAGGHPRLGAIGLHLHTMSTVHLSRHHRAHRRQYRPQQLHVPMQPRHEGMHLIVQIAIPMKKVGRSSITGY